MGTWILWTPHIIVRFMSIDSADELWKSRLIAMIWVFISLLGAIAVGITGIGVLQIFLKWVEMLKRYLYS